MTRMMCVVSFMLIAMCAFAQDSNVVLVKQGPLGPGIALQAAGFGFNLVQFLRDKNGDRINCFENRVRSDQFLTLDTEEVSLLSTREIDQAYAVCIEQERAWIKLATTVAAYVNVVPADIHSYLSVHTPPPPYPPLVREPKMLNTVIQNRARKMFLGKIGVLQNVGKKEEAYSASGIATILIVLVGLPAIAMQMTLKHQPKKNKTGFYKLVQWPFGLIFHNTCDVPTHFSDDSPDPHMPDNLWEAFPTLSGKHSPQQPAFQSGTPHMDTDTKQYADGLREGLTREEIVEIINKAFPNI